MAIYAIGDVQGCFDELEALIARIAFDPARDRLWFVGDLVNRGPKSLEVLRYVRALGERAVVVLGNHDLHLVCLYEGFTRGRRDDTFADLFAALDAKVLIDWLRSRPLMHAEHGYAMVHAGVLPQWTIERSLELAQEAAAALRAGDYRDFLAHLYGSRPERWDDSLAGWDRLRVIVNAMTRMRFCTPGGVMEFHAKGAEPPSGYVPWYATRAGFTEAPIVVGHWSALGLKLTDRLLALDTGCVWGGSLSAVRLEDRALFQIPCRGYQAPGGE
ncbi:MAG: symmetrical bis(5'-nucleosyl)-tetraphosphatase [Betaproteobacteria bacterium]|nr:symmetrical bis(5'-nucleosyl)-tetraphosphatase [Betaproteobacteria bacterium]